MSDSGRPHRWQPTRLPRPWDSPGKNTGVDCHFLLQHNISFSSNPWEAYKGLLSTQVYCKFQLSLLLNKRECLCIYGEPNLALALRRIDHIFTFFHKLSTRCLYVSLRKGNKREKDLEVLCVENWHWWSQRQKCWGIFPQKLITWGLSPSNRVYLKSHMRVTLRCLLWEGNSQVGYVVSISVFVCVCMGPCLITQPCPTPCNPMDCSPPVSSVHGISQARILKWVAISYSKGSSRPRDRTFISCIGRWVLYHLSDQYLQLFKCIGLQVSPVWVNVSTPYYACRLNSCQMWPAVFWTTEPWRTVPKDFPMRKQNSEYQSQP